MGERCGILKCRRCGLVYKELYPGAAGLQRIYSRGYVHFEEGSRPPGPAEVNGARQKLARCLKVLDRHDGSEPLRLLDVGCGAGGFVRIASEMGMLAEGIDPYLPEALANGQLSRREPGEVAPQSYDLAVLLNVIEHLDDPLPLFAAVHRVLKPGGALLVNCPYGDSLARRFYRAGWGHLSLDEHLLFWTPRSLRRTLRKAGFAGRISYRIAGSPFPYGRAPSGSAPSDPETAGSRCRDEDCRTRLQRKAWRLARTLQSHRALAGLVRHLVDISCTGDYLEFAIGA